MWLDVLKQRKFNYEKCNYINADACFGDGVGW